MSTSDDGTTTVEVTGPVLEAAKQVAYLALSLARYHNGHAMALCEVARGLIEQTAEVPHAE